MELNIDVVMDRDRTAWIPVHASLPNHIKVNWLGINRLETVGLLVAL